MINKKTNKKAHQLSTILTVIVLVISVISFGLYIENSKIVVNNENEVTGNAVGMEKVNSI